MQPAVSQTANSSASPEANTPHQRFGLLARSAVLLTVALTAARIAIAEVVGFGDAEALYASYALFRQATYLDHPGLIGWLGALVAGDIGTPSPVVVHRLTSLIAGGVPWLAGAAVRCAGASNKGVLCTVVAMAIVPEFAIGLFAFTPDVPLAVAWIGALGFAAIAIRSDPASVRCLATTVAAGLCTGIACASKATGVLLAVSLGATWLGRPMRDRLRTIAPYVAVASGLLITWPMLEREASLGWPMLQHRLVNTQVGFGPSLRNVGSLLGGQLLYLTPFVAIAVVLIAIDLCRHTKHDPIDRLLFNVTIPPFVVLAVLTILSPVAEPHWVAPAYIGLALHVGRMSERIALSRRLVIASVATSLLAISVVFAVVRYPILPKYLGRHYEAKYDIVNDLYVWAAGTKSVEDHLNRVGIAGDDSVTVVGPHWIVCAQLQASLGKGVRVGCETPEGDDFQLIVPRSAWEHDEVVLYVTDDRFPVELSERFPDRVVTGVSKVNLRRGGVTVRTIRSVQLSRMGAS